MRQVLLEFDDSLLFNSDVHKKQIMSISIAQSRQQLSALIDAAQSAPQVITKRNVPVAVILSADYFKRTPVAAHSANNVYSSIMAARAAHLPTDDLGLVAKATRSVAWTRSNSFTEAE